MLCKDSVVYVTQLQYQKSNECYYFVAEICADSFDCDNFT